MKLILSNGNTTNKILYPFPWWAHTEKFTTNTSKLWAIQQWFLATKVVSGIGFLSWSGPQVTPVVVLPLLLVMITRAEPNMTVKQKKKEMKKVNKILIDQGLVYPYHCLRGFLWGWWEQMQFLGAKTHRKTLGIAQGTGRNWGEL